MLNLSTFIVIPKCKMQKQFKITSSAFIVTISKSSATKYEKLNLIYVGINFNFFLVTWCIDLFTPFLGLWMQTGRIKYISTEYLLKLGFYILIFISGFAYKLKTLVKRNLNEIDYTQKYLLDHSTKPILIIIIITLKIIIMIIIKIIK